MSKSKNGLQNAIDFDAYNYLERYGPHYIDAIEAELARGMTPEEIRSIVARNVGPDRMGLALRCEQAARYLKGLER